jgi:hypothetical protein
MTVAFLHLLKAVNGRGSRVAQACAMQRPHFGMSAKLIAVKGARIAPVVALIATGLWHGQVRRVLPG